MFKVQYLLNGISKTATFYTQHSLTDFVSLLRKNAKASEIIILGNVLNPQSRKIGR